MFRDTLRKKLHDMMEAGILDRGLILLEDAFKPILNLFEQRKIPGTGWTDAQIKLFFQVLASMDTDKDTKAARVGEREGRTASDYVLSLSEGFAHGIGRSGDIFAIQPKAPGGSIINMLSSHLATSLLKSIGLPRVKKSIVLPVATGMSLATCLASIHQEHSKESNKDPWDKSEIIMPRLDHKSPIKGIKFAGFTLNTVASELSGDEVVVPFENIKAKVTSRTAAIVTTNAFFPPRAPDCIKEVAKYCKDENIPHVVNNSYGVQNDQYLKTLRGAMDAGRIDYIIQSTDKNFLTPVGGAVVASSSAEKIEQLSRVYAGRASAQPLVQFIASVLTLGLTGYKTLMAEQVENRKFLEVNVRKIAERIGQRLLETHNPVAIAMTLHDIPRDIGGKLYNLRVTGPRCVYPGDFGSCIDSYPSPYLTLNAGIGARRTDFVKLVRKLDTLFGR
ncbi:MAG: O-phosphoseryl-tRNA(Sec) selenium transferase [Promethearchaeota archaeon]